jgi:tRNA threonylcarbamoyladenosine biosynthesis protein TsaE
VGETLLRQAGTAKGNLAVSRNYKGVERVLQNADATRALGEALGRTAQPGDVLWLHGELGAGKTEMTKGLAAGLGCTDHVSSPSFALIHDYRGGRLPLYHIDLYRLDSGSALDLGLEEYLEGEGLTVIEWGERLPNDFFPDGLDIVLTYADNGDSRQMTMTARGAAGERWLTRID